MLVALIWAPAVRAQVRIADFEFGESIEGPLRVEADSLTAREGGDHLLLTGGVHLRGRQFDARAEWMEVFTRQQRVVLSGSVRVIDGAAVVLCDRLEFDRLTSRTLLTQATLLVKRQTTVEGLADCRTASELTEAGSNAYRLVGERWVRESGGYLVDRARFTPCDCGPDEAPSWELVARQADVIPDQRAWLDLPVLYLKGLPVLALPVGYLPLSERRSGLLMPQFNYSGRDGFVLSESLFLTLGEAADTTWSLDWIEERGLRQRIEIRAAPFARSWFSVRLAHIADGKAAGEDEPDAHRFTGELEAFAVWPGRLALRADIRLYSDSDINRDFISEMAGRAADYAPSRIGLAWRTDHQSLAVDAAWFQDLRLAAVDLFGVADEAELARWGMDPVGDTIQRLGALGYDLAPVSLFGWPLMAGLRLELANLSSLQAAWRDWGQDGTPNAREPSYQDAPAVDRGLDDGPGGEADGRLGPGELRRAVRLLVEPELRWPQRFGRWARLEARLAHRQLVYLPHGPQAPDESTRGISFASLQLASELSRAYGQGAERIGHLVAPWVRLAGAWRGLESDPALPYLDLMDRLVSDAVQGLIGLDNGLYLPDGRGGYERVLGIGLSQGLDLRTGRLAQFRAVVEWSRFPLDTRLGAGLDWQRLELVELDGALRLADRRGDSLQVSYLFLPARPDELGRPLPVSERTQRELDLLFGLAPLPLRGMGEQLHAIGIQAAVALAWGLSVRGGLYVDLHERQVNSYGAGASYQSDCRCWGLSVAFNMLRGQDLPDLFFVLDLGLLGRAGGSTASRF